MKSKLLLLLVALLIVTGFALKASAAEEAAPFKPFSVYTDSKAPDNHYIPSGWMGDYGDLSFNDKVMDGPHAGTTQISHKQCQPLHDVWIVVRRCPAYSS